MTTLGWSALGSVILKVSSQAETLLEAFSFANVAITVCAVVTAIVLLASSEYRERARTTAYARRPHDDTADNLRALAGQLRCAESRARLLMLAERVL